MPVDKYGCHPGVSGVEGGGAPRMTATLVRCFAPGDSSGGFRSSFDDFTASDQPRSRLGYSVEYPSVRYHRPRVELSSFRC